MQNNKRAPKKHQHELGKQQPSTCTRKAWTDGAEQKIPLCMLPGSAPHSVMNYWVTMKFEHIYISGFLPLTSCPAGNSQTATSVGSHCFSSSEAAQTCILLRTTTLLLQIFTDLKAEHQEILVVFFLACFLICYSEPFSVNTCCYLCYVSWVVHMEQEEKDIKHITG